jgi:1-pyrroline-5-carboxylate dehydrogenase
MFDSVIRVPRPVNEPVRSYEPGGPHRESLKVRLASMATERVEIPSVIGGKEVMGASRRQVTMPHSHQEVLGEYSRAGSE